MCRGHAPPPVSTSLTPRPASSAQAWLPSPGSEPCSATDEPTATSGWAKGLFLASFLGVWETVWLEPSVTWPSCGDQTRSTRAVPCPSIMCRCPGVTASLRTTQPSACLSGLPGQSQLGERAGKWEEDGPLWASGVWPGALTHPSVSVHGHSPVASVGAQPAAPMMSLRVGMQPSDAQGAALLMLQSTHHPHRSLEA